MPLRELERLQAVNRFLTLEINKEKELRDIVKMASEICGTSTALITLLDDKTQFIKFKVGFDKETTAKKDAFCSHVIEQNEVMMVPDALMDVRFVENPLVTGNPNIRFYAGAPLTTQDGHNLGSLCVIDQSPKLLSQLQLQMLEVLSRQVIHILEFEMSISILKKQYIEAKNSEIKLRSFFESSRSCHLLLGKQFEILAFNKSLEKFINNTFGETVSEGDDIRFYVHANHSPNFIENYNNALAGTAAVSETYLTYEQHAIWWYMTYEPAYNQAGEIIGVSFNATDITKRISQEKLVTAQNDSLKKIAFMQSHELRRPVSTIMGIMNLIKSEDYMAEREELMILEKAVDELDSKIRMIVDYTF
jgi:PAS domain S-box-containing protein